MLSQAINRYDFRYASAPDPLGTFNHRDATSATLQIISGHQPVYAGTDNQDVRFVHGAKYTCGADRHRIDMGPVHNDTVILSSFLDIPENFRLRLANWMHC